MILRTIRVEGWRCFAAAIEVGPLGDGLNIIHGPNGSGKSTLMMALVRGLFDSHSVSGSEIKSLRPWGRPLNPKVTIEFQQGEICYRLQKQFVNSASSLLSRKEDGRYVPLAESRDADERARQILAAEAPSRGVSDQRHWGLAQILWATQGHLQIEQLSGPARSTLQDALSAQVSGPGAEALEKKITEAFDEYFTPGGKLRGGALAPAVVGSQTQLEEARVKQRELSRRLEEFDVASRRIEDLRQTTDQAKHSERELTDKLKVAREQAQAYNVLLGQRKLHEQEVRGAEERYKNLKERIDAIARARHDLKTAGEQLQKLLDDAPAQAEQVEQFRGVAERTKQAVEQVRAQRNQVQAARQEAQWAERFTSAIATRAELDKRLEQIDAAQREYDQLNEQRNRLSAPDAKTLASIKRTARERDDARLRLDAAVITVRVIPEADSNVEITAGEETGITPLQSDVPLTIKGAPDVAFRIPGVARVEATGPTTGVNELRDQWQRATAQLDALTASFGTGDVEQLEQLHAQAAELDGQLSQANVKLRTLLAGRQIEEVRAERRRAGGSVEEILTKFPAWHDSPPDASALVRKADEIERQFTPDIDRVEAEHDQARSAFDSALKRQIIHDADLKNLRERTGDIERRLAVLCDDTLSDAQRTAKLTEIALERDAACGKFSLVDEQFKSFGQDPGKLVAQLEGQIEATRQSASTAARQLNMEEGRLQQLAAEAPYSALAAVEEKIDRLQDEIHRQRLQIDAVRLLYDTLVQQKRDVFQSVLGPVQSRANQTLQRIAGPRLADIRFDDSLLPQRVAPRLAEEPVELDQISGGEREQLYFAVRLALADLAFGNERQLLVLDDVFTYTDTTRLSRITAILDEAAQRFQIVLLTCHPERYRELPNAKFFDLERIVSSVQ